MAATETQEKTTKLYRGNCHCGAVVFEIECPEIKTVSECDCSICFRKAYAWTFPGHDDIKYIKGGEDIFTKYTFNKGTTAHCFCPNCGTPVMGINSTNPPGYKLAMNARCFQGVDIWAMDKKNYDGLSLPPAYKPPVYTGPEPEVEVEGGKIYHGSCHCGAVKVAANIPSLDTYKDDVVNCNCSVCCRNGYIWIYPLRPQVILEGEENLAYYKFGEGLWNKAFCRRCGVHICNERDDTVGAEQLAAASEEGRGFYRPGQTPLRPLNLRVLHAVDKQVLGGLPIEKSNGWEEIMPAYVNP